MLNFACERRILEPLVPAGTELDLWEKQPYISLVAFLFRNTRVMGIAVPFHQHFEEVNLRFYVRHKSSDGWRRGVVFIKELVPRFAIAFTARILYNENYISLPMSHQLKMRLPAVDQIDIARYSWRFEKQQHYLELTTAGDLQPTATGSKAEFIAEHLRWTPKTGPQVKMDFCRSAGEKKADYESQTETA